MSVLLVSGSKLLAREKEFQSNPDFFFNQSQHFWSSVEVFNHLYLKCLQNDKYGSI